MRRAQPERLAEVPEAPGRSASWGGGIGQAGRGRTEEGGRLQMVSGWKYVQGRGVCGGVGV